LDQRGKGVAENFLWRSAGIPSKQLDHGGAECVQIIMPCRHDFVDLSVVDLPVNMEQQVSESRHLLQASGQVRANQTGLLK
jgi:hypothetical protein